MRFGNPQYLHLLWVVLALGLFHLVVRRRRRRRLERFAGPALLPRLVRAAGEERALLRRSLFLGGVTCLILAAARPQWGIRPEEISRRGVDVIIAVDVSQSMDAEDVQPSRLRKAKMEMAGLVDCLGGDRVGLVAFAGTAFVQCPLTLDHAAARMFLEIIDTRLIPRPGTAIARAIDVAVAAFRSRERKYKALVLLTDGEDQEGDAREAARRAAAEGVVIHTVAIGSPAGEPIPLRDESGRVAGYKKDRAGRPVTTRVDEELLEGVAAATGGLYLRATQGEMELEKLCAAIAAMEKKEFQARMHTRYEERFQGPLALGFLLLVAERLVPERRRRTRGTAGKEG